MYAKDYRIGNPEWTEIMNAIDYASKSVETIKATQKRDTVRYNTNGWYVSLLTIDTFAIYKIIRQQNILKHTELVQEKLKAKNNFWLICFLGLTVMGVGVYKFRQHSR